MCARRHRRHSGFSLIELSITMIIAGLFLAGLLKIYNLESERARLATTKERLLELRTAINVYAAAHGRLPCPASPSGKSARGENPCIDGKPPQGVAVFTPVGKEKGIDMTVWTGAVPAAELDIPFAETLDGWHNRFTYAVTLGLTQQDSMMKSPAPAGGLGIANEHGENTLDEDGAGRYVVLSHGRSAKGAWTAHGVRIPCDRRALDAENCDGDNIFVAAGQSLGRDGAFYDDFLVHDQLDTAGSLTGKLAVCHTRQKYYAPEDPKADDNGCAGFNEYAWQGLCLHSHDEGETGPVSASGYAAATLPPALTAEDTGKCSCPEGYTLKKTGNWRDVHEGTEAIETECPFKTNIGNGWETPNLIVGKHWFTDDKGNEIVCRNAPKRPPTGYTALYTCVTE